MCLILRFFFYIDENECKCLVCIFFSLCRNMYGSYVCDCFEGYVNRGLKDLVWC